MDIFTVAISGNKRVISTSKIKKITAIKKKCREKGMRALDFGSNPHSNGEFFSRSEWVFLDRVLARIIRMQEITIISVLDINIK